jgi:hypothetical protein
LHTFDIKNQTILFAFPKTGNYLVKNITKGAAKNCKCLTLDSMSKSNKKRNSGSVKKGGESVKKYRMQIS